MARARKLALAGFGQVAEHAHLPAYRDDPRFQIVALAEESTERQAAARALLPEARHYPSLAALLAAEKEIEFVDIATPPFLHAPQVLATLAAGRHALCEKPLTLNLAELEEIERAARRARRAVYTVDNWKHAPLFLKAAELVDAGRLGALSRVELATRRQAPASAALASWRTDPAQSGGGILVDHGWHSLYLIRRFIGEDSWKKIIRLSPPLERGAEREFSAELVFSRASARLDLTWLATRRENSGLIAGARGRLVLGDDRLTLESGGSAERFDFPEKISHGSAHPAWFKTMLDDFLAEADGKNPGASLRQSRFCAEAIAALYAQACAPAGSPR